MALNNLVATIYRCLHEMCTTFGTNINVQFGCLLSTVLPLPKNQTYYVTLPNCLRTNLPRCLAREMAMICGQETDYFKPIRNMAMTCVI